MAHRLAAIVVGIGAAFTPVVASAQSVSVTRSIFADQPYTIIYPDVMIASGGAGEPLTINHPNAPLQCDLSVVAVEDTSWTPEGAVASLDPAATAAAWSETFPGFVIANSGTTAYQDATALFYEGTSEGSPMGIPITLVHSETVREGRGYSLDCIFSTEVAEQIRPVVDFIIANFATRSDAECCIGATPEAEPAPAQ